MSSYLTGIAVLEKLQPEFGDSLIGLVLGVGLVVGVHAFLPEVDALLGHRSLPLQDVVRGLRQQRYFIVVLLVLLLVEIYVFVEFQKRVFEEFE